MGGADPGVMHARCSTASCGFCAAARVSRTCPSDSRRIRPVTAVSNTGSVRDGTLRRILEALTEDLLARGALDLGECFIDGTFVVAKGVPGVGTTKRGNGTKLMAVADRAGLPLAVHTAAASPHEVILAPDTLAASFTAERPERLIGDKAYDSDPLDVALAAVGIELIAPHRANHKHPTTQDGRPLRGTIVAGRWHGCSLGCKTSGACWCAMNTMPSVTSGSCISAVSSFSSDAIYETACSLMPDSRKQHS
jgi:hypothetical protein